MEEEKHFSKLQQDFYILTINILQLYYLLLNKIKLLAVPAKNELGKGIYLG